MVKQPSDWSLEYLEAISTIKTGDRNNQDKVDNGLYPFYVRSEKVERINSFSYDTEAILIPGDGNVGSIFHYINGKFDVHQRVYAITNFKETVSAKYIYWYLSKFFKEHALNHTSKATVDSLRLPDLKKFEIWFPIKKEQQAIAEVLSSFDTHISNLTNLIEKKKMIRDGAVEELVSGKRRLDGFEGEWELVPLFDKVDLLSGLTYAPLDVRKTGVLVLRSSNIQNDRLTFQDNVYVRPEIVNSELVKKGDIIVCVRNGSQKLIGKSAIVKDNISATTGAFMANLRCKKIETSSFLYFYTKTAVFQNFVNKILGATINQITKSDFESLQIKLPVDLKEQQAIADILTTMDDEIETLEQEKEKYEQLKQGAMDDLLTGKVRLV